MRLKITKWYNRVEHSYLAVLEVTASVGEDAAVFVVKDLPPAAESASSESPSPSASSLEVVCQPACFFNIEHYEICALTPEGIVDQFLPEVDREAYCAGVGNYVGYYFADNVCKKPGTEHYYGTSCQDAEGIWEGYYNIAIMICCVPCASSESSAPSASESASTTLIYPTRVLVSVASLTDLMVYGTSIPVVGALYRAPTVAMLFRSELHMNTTLDMVQNYVAINAGLQRAVFEPTEIVELSDPGHGLNLDQLYLFR